MTTTHIFVFKDLLFGVLPLVWSLHEIFRVDIQVPAMHWEWIQTLHRGQIKCINARKHRIPETNLTFATYLIEKVSIKKLHLLFFHVWCCILYFEMVYVTVQEGNKKSQIGKNPSYDTFKNQLENKGQEGQWVELQEGVSDAGESRWTWSTSKDRSPDTQ